jgi:hypothetical protein
MEKIVDRVELEIENLDSAMTSLFIGGTPQGSLVTLSLVCLDSSNNPVDGSVVTLFQGEIDKWI